MSKWTRYPTCPNCGRKINMFHRPEKCAFTGELICDQCIVNDRFSNKIAESIPPEFWEKFRFYNILEYILMSVLVYGILATTWPSFVGWDLADLIGILMDFLVVFGKLLAVIILAIIGTRLPKLGTWMFYRWVSIPANQERMMNAIAKHAQGDYVSEDRIYNKKMHLFAKFKANKWPLIEKIIIGFNLTLIPLFFIVRNIYFLAGSYFSMIVGIFFTITFLLNIGLIWFASAFHCRKEPSNRQKRKRIELQSWIYVIFIPIVLICLLLSYVNRFGFLMDEKSDILTDVLEVGHQIAFVIQCVVMCNLAWTLSKETPNFDWKKNEDNVPAWTEPRKQKVYNVIRRWGVYFFILLLVACFIISLEMLFTDFAMAIGIAGHYLVGIYFVIIFSLWKIASKKPIPWLQRRHNYSSFVKLGLVIIIINFLPILGTTMWTNPSLETQFDDQFGPDWEDRITSQEYARMHQVPFSMFDAYFGYYVPINAKLYQVYMQDHPRFVKNRTNDVKLSNGSAKFPGITHDMIFDAYLPATLEFEGVTFGDGRAEKFPVIISMHGVGMDRGSGNANWSAQNFANMGYAVFDMSYGFTDYADYPYYGGKERGYDFPDTINQIGQFTKYLEAHADEYHADLSNVYFRGISFGGWMALCCAYLANFTATKGNYSSAMQVKGVIPFYPASDIPSAGSEAWELGQDAGFLSEDSAYFRGSSIPEDKDFNPEWQWYNPLWIIENVPDGSLPATFSMHGTHDYMVPIGATRRLDAACKANGMIFIGGYYPFGSHAFDVVHFMPYGQSVAYYQARFMALTH